MNASKENCQKVIDIVQGMRRPETGERCRHILEFLEAALRRLPSEAAIAKDKTRKKKLAKIA